MNPTTNSSHSPCLPLRIRTTLSVLLLLGSLAGSALAEAKPRLVVLTDISPDKVEPDDMESIIRLFVHADMFEIEALIHSTGWSASVAKESYYQLIHEAIDLYEEDLPNLRKRSEQEGHRHDAGKQEIGYWPSPQYLRERTMMGSKNRGQKFIGEDNSSPGSDLIIQLADEEDDRPIWITVWGGGNTLAQAVWQGTEDAEQGSATDVPEQTARLYDYRSGRSPEVWQCHQLERKFPSMDASGVRKGSPVHLG